MALVWIIKSLFKYILPAIEGLTEATQHNTSATKSADAYLQQRNGRDIEKHAELLAATREIPVVMQQIADNQSEAILHAVNIKNQHVDNQYVDKQMGRKRKVQL
jgi:DNA-binding protein Fis